MQGQRVIKKRNRFLIYLFTIITLGIYSAYWLVSTKRDINSLGGDIPNAFWGFVPIVQLWWIYRYGRAYAKIRGGTNGFGWALVFFTGLIPIFVQGTLNKIAEGGTNQNPQQNTTQLPPTLPQQPIQPVQQPQQQTIIPQQQSIQQMQQPQQPIQ